MQSGDRRPAGHVRSVAPVALGSTVAYIALGLLWLTAGNRVIESLVPEERHTLVHSLSHALFVLFSAVVLFLLLRTLLGALRGGVETQAALSEELRLRMLDQQQLARRLLVAEEETRRGVAKDLHDGPLQALTLSFMQLDASHRATADGRAAADDSLREVMATIREASEEIRGVVRALHPPLLAELGLSAAVQRYCAEVALRSRREVRFEGPPSLPPLSDALSIALFRITQEAVANAVKHTPAGTIAVRLDQLEADVQVCVEDEGPGFDPSRPPAVTGPGRGLGLLSMRERAESVGARLSVKSDSGGTLVCVRAALVAGAARADGE